MRKFINIFWVLVGFPEISMRVCKNLSMQVFRVQTFSTQILPGPNFFKPSIPGSLRIFRAFASLCYDALSFKIQQQLFEMNRPTLLCPNSCYTHHQCYSRQLTNKAYVKINNPTLQLKLREINKMK